jgi:mono/diheme cytochrome c family protein
MSRKIRARRATVGWWAGAGIGLVGVALLTVAGGGADRVAAQHRQPRQPSTSKPAATPARHGTPAGWKFAWPKGGDLAKGREVFVKLECQSCHEVRGERFPPTGNPQNLGPELSQMGPLHEAEYFAEAIINPSAAIEPGKGYAAPDGSSKMPSYNDLLTVQEVVDLVAYLSALRPPPGAAPAPGGHKH